MFRLRYFTSMVGTICAQSTAAIGNAGSLLESSPAWSLSPLPQSPGHRGGSLAARPELCSDFCSGRWQHKQFLLGSGRLTRNLGINLWGSSTWGSHPECASCHSSQATVLRNTRFQRLHCCSACFAVTLEVFVSLTQCFQFQNLKKQRGIFREICVQGYLS